jgi:hypothetical protein
MHSEVQLIRFFLILIDRPGFIDKQGEMTDEWNLEFKI